MRLKIQLGELVKKAGLDQENIIVILGFLPEVAERLADNKAIQH